MRQLTASHDPTSLQRRLGNVVFSIFEIFISTEKGRMDLGAIGSLCDSYSSNMGFCEGVRKNVLERQRERLLRRLGALALFDRRRIVFQTRSVRAGPRTSGLLTPDLRFSHFPASPPVQVSLGHGKGSLETLHFLGFPGPSVSCSSPDL